VRWHTFDAERVASSGTDAADHAGEICVNGAPAKRIMGKSRR
jgi:hypothetical protein